MTTYIRFRYIDSVTDDIYVGDAEIEDDTAIITSAFRLNLTDNEEVFPYSTDFPVTLRRELEECAFECRTTPPAMPVELPSDWDEINVIGVTTEYDIEVAAAIPDVKTDAEAQLLGLSTVRRVKQTSPKRYTVRAIGCIADVRRELHKIRLF